MSCIVRPLLAITNQAWWNGLNVGWLPLIRLNKFKVQGRKWQVAHQDFGRNEGTGKRRSVAHPALGSYLRPWGSCENMIGTKIEPPYFPPGLHTHMLLVLGLKKLYASRRMFVIWWFSYKTVYLIQTYTRPVSMHSRWISFGHFFTRVFIIFTVGRHNM